MDTGNYDYFSFFFILLSRRLTFLQCDRVKGINFLKYDKNIFKYVSVQDKLLEIWLFIQILFSFWIIQNNQLKFDTENTNFINKYGKRYNINWERERERERGGGRWIYFQSDT